MYSGRSDGLLRPLGFPIRKSPDQCSVGNSPELFAATHVLHRLSAPRHPPHALSSLLTSISLTRSTLTASSRSQTRDRGPGPCSSQRASGNAENSTHSKLNSVSSYALFKERARPHACHRANLVELIGIRTDDLQLAKLVLSQLSYSPGPSYVASAALEQSGPGWTRTTDLTLIRRAL